VGVVRGDGAAPKCPHHCCHTCGVSLVDFATGRDTMSNR